jgi:hypothetical protein
MLQICFDIWISVKELADISAARQADQKTALLGLSRGSQMEITQWTGVHLPILVFARVPPITRSAGRSSLAPPHRAIAAG